MHLKHKIFYALTAVIAVVDIGLFLLPYFEEVPATPPHRCAAAANPALAHVHAQCFKLRDQPLLTAGVARCMAC
jgi:hypothetical protein